MPELLDRRRRDLEAQLDSLPRELTRWEALTKTPEFEKHHSQVVALSRQMRDLNERVRDTWKGSSDFGAIRKAQNNCATVQRLWDYYREKLMTRFDPKIGPYLRAADAYVWSCYEPVLVDRRAANPAVAFREPPLVSFNAEMSPWAQSRRKSGKAPAPGERTDPEPTDAVPMPIAILGIPWWTIERLPNLAALAHETGHIVESDFGLQSSLETALDTATKSSALHEGWTYHWRKEVFADLFACFAAGPSSVWTLTESIPDSPARVEEKKRPADITGEWGNYPPATLRILMNLRALRVLGYASDADEIEHYWKADYPKHAMGDYEKDVDAVVTAVYEAAKLPESLNWAKLDLKYDAAFMTVAVWQKNDISPTTLYSPRMIVAAAGSIYRAPPHNVDVETVWQRLQKHMVESRPPGVLARQQARTAPGAPVLLRTDEIARTLFTDVVDDDD